MVLGHGRLLQGLPALGFSEHLERPADGADQRGGSVLLKRESGRIAARFRFVLDRVLETARGTDDGNRAVTQAVHLIQAAWLESRRHQEHVAAAFDQMRQPLVEADVDGHAVRVASLEILPEALVSRFPASEHHPRRVVGHQAVRASGNEVEPFLIRQA